MGQNTELEFITFKAGDDCPFCNEPTEMVNFSGYETGDGYNLPIEIVSIWEQYRCTCCDFEQTIHF